MKTKLLAALVAVTIILSPVSAQNLQFNSVVPIQEVKVNPETGAGNLVNVCGAVSINEKEHYWLTANHCLEDTDASYIRGEKVTHVMRDPTNDLAIVKTPTVSAPSVKLAAEAPKLADVVYTISYPLMMPVPLFFKGIITNARFEYDKFVYVVYQIPVAPGASGAPVFNEAGELVSVTQRGFTQGGYSPLGSGAHHEKLKALALWWEK